MRATYQASFNDHPPPLLRVAVTLSQETHVYQTDVSPMYQTDIRQGATISREGSYASLRRWIARPSPCLNHRKTLSAKSLILAYSGRVSNRGNLLMKFHWSSNGAMVLVIRKHRFLSVVFEDLSTYATLFCHVLSPVI